MYSIGTICVIVFYDVGTFFIYNALEILHILMVGKYIGICRMCTKRTRVGASQYIYRTPFWNTSWLYYYYNSVQQFLSSNW